MNMRRVRAISLLAGLISGAGTAQAGIIAGGPVSVATGGSVIVCRLLNFGGFNVSISARQIYDSEGKLLTPTSDNCPATLAPTKSCYFETTAPTSDAYVCRAVYVGIDENLTGVIEIFNGSFTPVTTLPLQRAR